MYAVVVAVETSPGWNELFIIITIIVLLNAGLIQSSATSFTWDLRQMKGGLPKNTWVKKYMLVIIYIIRDCSVLTYTGSTFCNTWAVLVSTIFYIFCSDGLPGIWSIKYSSCQGLQLQLELFWSWVSRFFYHY